MVLEDGWKPRLQTEGKVCLAVYLTLNSDGKIEILKMCYSHPGQWSLLWLFFSTANKNLCSFTEVRTKYFHPMRDGSDRATEADRSNAKFHSWERGTSEYVDHLWYGHHRLQLNWTPALSISYCLSCGAVRGYLPHYLPVVKVDSNIFTAIVMKSKWLELLFFKLSPCLMLTGVEI